MRANIPRTPPRPPIAELEGIYLQAMKEISVRLMESLPASDELWQILGQVETMLLEAQLRAMPLSELFGSGGVAVFCQSIIDEYSTDGEPVIPAAQDKSIKPDRRGKEPRGGINYRRKRRITAVMTSIVLLLATVLICWHTGLLRYWIRGSAYYLEELHNFQSESVEVGLTPIRITVPLEKVSGLSDTLYTDANGYRIALTALETYDHVGAITDPNTGETTYQRLRSWYMRMAYTVHASFKEVSYVEPPSEGVVRVTLADGMVYDGKLTWIESGASERGWEYARISLIDLPLDVNTEGATVTVELEPPRLVTWDRISTGPR